MKSETIRVLDKEKEVFYIRKLIGEDTARLTDFFSDLSKKTRRIFQPHPFTRGFAEKICKNTLTSRDIKLIILDSKSKKFVGYCFVNRPPIYSDFGYLGIVISEKYQGKGLGNKLMEASFNFSQSNGFQGIYLNVLEDNVKARSLYENLGFNIVARPLLISFLILLREGFYGYGLLGFARKILKEFRHEAKKKKSIWMYKELK